MKRYESTSTFSRFDGKKVYFTTEYPIIQPQDSDIIIVSNEGDYLDSLAFRYYSDPSLYWIIGLANNIGKGRMSVPPGLTLRIPTNVNSILVDFNNLNENSSTQ